MGFAAGEVRLEPKIDSPEALLRSRRCKPRFVRYQNTPKPTQPYPNSCQDQPKTTTWKVFGEFGEVLGVLGRFMVGFGKLWDPWVSIKRHNPRNCPIRGSKKPRPSGKSIRKRGQGASPHLSLPTTKINQQKGLQFEVVRGRNTSGNHDFI